MWATSRVARGGACRNRKKIELGSGEAGTEFEGLGRNTMLGTVRQVNRLPPAPPATGAKNTAHTVGESGDNQGVGGNDDASR